MSCPSCDQHLAEVRELRSELEAQRIVLDHVTAEMKRLKRMCEMKDRLINVADALLTQGEADEALVRYRQVFGE